MTKRIRLKSKDLADLFSAQIMAGLEGMECVPPKDDRLLDLWESIERYARDTITGRKI